MPQAQQSPLPSIGELLKHLAYAFSHVNEGQTGRLKVSLNRMAQGSDMDPEEIGQFVSYHLAQLRECDPQFASLLAEAMSAALEFYRHVVREIDCGGLNRKQVMPALCVHVLLPIFSDVIQAIANLAPGPNFESWADANADPTADVLQWWLGPDQAPSAFAKRLSPHWASMKRGRDYKSIEGALYGWLNQTQEMSVRLAFDFYDGQNSTLARWLLLARAWQKFWQQVRSPDKERLRKVWQIRLRMNSSDLDISNLQDEITRIIQFDDRHKRFFQLLDQEPNYIALMNHKSPKVPEDAVRTKALLKQLEAKNPLPELSWQFAAQYARYHALMGEHRDALSYYNTAFEAARYRNGKMARALLNELLIVEAFLRRTRYKDKWRGWARLMGLTPTVENPELTYIRLFPLEAHYPEAPIDDLRCQLERAPTGLLLRDEWAKRRPDYRNPNRNVAGFGAIPKPQLMIYASLNKSDAVQKLLRKGADANLLAEDGGSALLCAVQARAEESIDVLLPASAPQTINAVTRKENLTPLYVAIEHGDPNLVARLLNAGADPNLRCGPGLQRPMPHAEMKCSTPISHFSDFLSDDALKSTIRHLPNGFQPTVSGFEEDRLDAMRRFMAASATNPRHRQIINSVAEYFMNGEGVPLSDRREVVSILLEAGATNANESS